MLFLAWCGRWASLCLRIPVEDSFLSNILARLYSVDDHAACLRLSSLCNLQAQDYEREQRCSLPLVTICGNLLRAPKLFQHHTMW